MSPTWGEVNLVGKFFKGSTKVVRRLERLVTRDLMSIIDQF